ncbi:ABC transporter ATP-binding protein [Pseudalkalibacillus hwajinpoensis]|uniref:ABC transporter ATP-binding protein n=1 Tax=Guptibacillus hwajinpoensis TaxID=208199 RepID=UPI001CFF090A|nr:ABC transporter ATP-binding protein [Pseudalkalibacillus hwajinpoensis]
MGNVYYFLKQIHAFAGKILYFNLIAMMLIGFLEGAGILLLIPLIGITGIVDIDVNEIPFLAFFKFLEGIPASWGLLIILGSFIVLVISQHIIQRQITVRNTTIQQGFLKHLREETYRRVLHSNWSFFIKNRKSDLINILFSEVGRASSGTNSLLQFLSSLIITSIQIGLAFLLAPVITTFVLLCGTVLIYFNRKFLKRSLALGDRNYELAKSYVAGITDQINGIKDIKSNTLEESRMTWFNDVTRRMQNEQIEYIKLKTTSQLYYKAASVILIAIFIYMSISLFNAQVGQLTLIVVIFSRLWPRVAGIQGAMEQIATTLPSFKAVKALQNECDLSREFDVKESLLQPVVIDNGIECRDIFFRYSQEGTYALKGINIVIPSNKMTAFVGRSGAGKSTLIDLLMGLNKPEKGEVIIDGVTLKSEHLLSLRQSISYVSQDPFLFNSTIRENLMLVAPNSKDDDLWNALDFSSAAEFVRKLPDGLDSLIGDRGIKLSGGERQRLVLARAILRNPSILVLDEATSALDTENETKIQDALERLKGKMTIIVIAHRLSTIRNADQVVVLDEGEVIQQGGFNQLAKEKRNVFSQLLQNQLKLTK